jgi:hypothetical protein
LGSLPRCWQQLADVPQEQLEIKLRAERKAGQLLKQMAQASALLNTPQRGPWPRAARARGKHMVFAHIGSR